MAGPGVRIGVLSLQGGVEEHLAALRSLDGVEARPVKTAAALDGLDGVILPGGESSAVGKLLADGGLGGKLRGLIAAGLPAWGTCMGAILLARDIGNDDRRHLSLMDIRVRRNAYGGQLDSFVERAPVDLPFDDRSPFPMVFIRAPVIESIGPDVRVVARSRGGISACVQGAMLATTFHPELSGDFRFHAYFARLAVSVKNLGVVA